MSTVKCPWCGIRFFVDPNVCQEGWAGVCSDCTLPMLFDAELRPRAITPSTLREMPIAHQAVIMEEMHKRLSGKVKKWSGWHVLKSVLKGAVLGKLRRARP